MPPITARPSGSMYGVPSPCSAGTAQTPPLSGTDAASGPHSDALEITPSPSRSHCTAAPAVMTVPSRP
jgi:hypothetical protein